MKIKVDLHNHIKTPSKLNVNFNKVIDIIEKRLGNGGIIALVDFEDNRYLEFTYLKGYERENLGNAIYMPEKDITIIKGQEIPTKQGHLLVLGLNQNINIPSHKSLEDTIKQAKDNNGIIIADHPFYFEGVGNYLLKNFKILEDLDGIEIFNGEASFGIPKTPLNLNANKNAQNFFKEINKYFPNLGCLCSSDGHSLYEIGRSYSIIDKFYNNLNSDLLIESLRKSIKNHKDFKEDKKGEIYGKIGAIEHITRLIPALGIKTIKSRIKNSN